MAPRKRKKIVVKSKDKNFNPHVKTLLLDPDLPNYERYIDLDCSDTPTRLFFETAKSGELGTKIPRERRSIHSGTEGQMTWFN